MLNIKVDALKAEIEELSGEFYICFYGLETEIKLKVSCELIEELHDELKELNDEKTYEQLEDEILDLTIEKENLQETIDFKDEYIDRIIHNNIF